MYLFSFFDLEASQCNGEQLLTPQGIPIPGDLGGAKEILRRDLAWDSKMIGPKGLPTKTACAKTSWEGKGKGKGKGEKELLAQVFMILVANTNLCSLS